MARSAAFQGSSAAALIVADGLCLQIRTLLRAAVVPAEALRHCANPLAHINQLLQQRRRLGQPVQELHLIAHGRPGSLRLGGQWLDARAWRRAASDLAAWNIERLGLWSCDLAADPGAVPLLEALSGASVWASHERLLRNQERSQLELHHSRGRQAPWHLDTLLDQQHLQGLAFALSLEEPNNPVLPLLLDGSNPQQSLYGIGSTDTTTSSDPLLGSAGLDLQFESRFIEQPAARPTIAGLDPLTGLVQEPAGSPRRELVVVDGSLGDCQATRGIGPLATRKLVHPIGGPSRSADALIGADWMG